MANRRSYMDSTAGYDTGRQLMPGQDYQPGYGWDAPNPTGKTSMDAPMDAPVGVAPTAAPTAPSYDYKPEKPVSPFPKPPLGVGPTGPFNPPDVAPTGGPLMPPTGIDAVKRSRGLFGGDYQAKPRIFDAPGGDPGYLLQLLKQLGIG